MTYKWSLAPAFSSIPRMVLFATLWVPVPFNNLLAGNYERGRGTYTGNTPSAHCNGRLVSHLVVAGGNLNEYSGLSTSVSLVGLCGSLTSILGIMTITGIPHL